MTNMKSHMGFPLAPRSMTLDDLELLKFEFFEISNILVVHGLSIDTKIDDLG